MLSSDIHSNPRNLTLALFLRAQIHKHDDDNSITITTMTAAPATVTVLAQKMIFHLTPRWDSSVWWLVNAVWVPFNWHRTCLIFLHNLFLLFLLFWEKSHGITCSFYFVDVPYSHRIALRLPIEMSRIVTYFPRLTLFLRLANGSTTVLFSIEMNQIKFLGYFLSRQWYFGREKEEEGVSRGTESVSVFEHTVKNGNVSRQAVNQIPPTSMRFSKSWGFCAIQSH